jgi:hypothetical protein
VSAQVAADLRAAAEVLRRDGWQQGHYWDSVTGCHCIFGAAANAVLPAAHSPEALLYGIDEAPWQRMRRATDFLAAIVAKGYDGLDGWNDAPGRTADEVIAALLAAADAAEATS